MSRIHQQKAFFIGNVSPRFPGDDAATFIMVVRPEFSKVEMAGQKTVDLRRNGGTESANRHLVKRQCRTKANLLSIKQKIPARDSDVAESESFPKHIPRHTVYAEHTLQRVEIRLPDIPQDRILPVIRQGNTLQTAAIQRSFPGKLLDTSPGSIKNAEMELSWTALLNPGNLHIHRNLF